MSGTTGAVTECADLARVFARRRASATACPMVLGLKYQPIGRCRPRGSGLL